MKKWCLILSAIFLLTTGCTSQKQNYIPQPADFDNSGKKTVLYCGNKSFPLSLSVDGEQQIENGVYWYYELCDTYDQSWTDPFYTYHSKKLELNGSKPYDKAVKEKCFATNGNWPLFLNPVHTEYTASNQESADAALKKPIEDQLLTNNIEGEAGIITDTWSSDMDGDGIQEILFKACNCSVKDAKQYYCFLGYQKGDSCQTLYQNTSASAPCAAEELNPIVCDLDGDGKWGLLLYKKGDFESFTFYDFSGGNFTKSYEIIF